MFSKTLSLSLIFVPVGPGRVSHLLILIQLKSHKSYYVHGAPQHKNVRGQVDLTKTNHQFV